MGTDTTALVAEILHCIHEASHWDVVLPKVAAALGGHAAALQHQSQTDIGLDMLSWSGLDDDWVETYLRDWDAFNPWRTLGLAYGWSQPEKLRYTAIHASRLIAPSEYRKTAVFNECMRDANLYDCVCMPLFADEHAAWIAVFADRRKNVFDDDAIAKACGLATEIGRAASLSQKLNAQRKERARTGDPRPILIIEDSKFVGANAAADAALFKTGAASAEGGRLLFHGPDINRRFSDFLARDSARKTRGALYSVDLGDGKFVSVYRPPGEDATVGNRAEYLLLFDCERGGFGRAEQCANALSISKDDAELALLFAEGFSPEDVAQMSGGSAAEYRARMKRLFMRLGVKDQGALVLRVLAAMRSVSALQAD